MKTCINCKAELDDNAVFCSACGAKQDAAPADTPAEPQTEVPSADISEVKKEETKPANDVMKELFHKVDATEDVTETMDENDIKANKAMGILSYIGALILIPFFAAKKSKFAMYHVKQAFTVFLLNLAWDGVLFSMAMPWLDHETFNGFAMFAMKNWYFVILVILSVIGKLFFLALTVLGIVHAAKGQAKKLPIVGKLR